MTAEHWVAIPDSRWYEISNHGNVRVVEHVVVRSNGSYQGERLNEHVSESCKERRLQSSMGKIPEMPNPPCGKRAEAKHRRTYYLCKQPYIETCYLTCTTSRQIPQ